MHKLLSLHFHDASGLCIVDSSRVYPESRSSATHSLRPLLKASEMAAVLANMRPDRLVNQPDARI